MILLILMMIMTKLPSKGRNLEEIFASEEENDKYKPQKAKNKNRAETCYSMSSSVFLKLKTSIRSCFHRALALGLV